MPESYLILTANWSIAIGSFFNFECFFAKYGYFHFIQLRYFFRNSTAPLIIMKWIRHYFLPTTPNIELDIVIEKKKRERATSSKFCHFHWTAYYFFSSIFFSSSRNVRLFLYSQMHFICSLCHAFISSQS